MRTKVKLLLACLFITGMMSCNDNEVDVEEQKVDITYSAMVNQGNSSSIMKSGVKAAEFDRGNAESYVSGIKISVVNNTYSVADHHRTFEFVPMGQTGIAMTDQITAGSNTFSATTITDSEEVLEEINGMTIISNEPDLELRAGMYAAAFKSQFPIYAELTSAPIVRDISYNSTETIPFTLNHLFGRLNIVFEGQTDLDYMIEIYDEGNDKYDEILYCTGPNCASGLILNDRNLNHLTELEITISVKPTGSNLAYSMLSSNPITIKGAKGVIQTHIIRFEGSINNNDLTYKAYFQPFTVLNGGEVITE